MYMAPATLAMRAAAQARQNSSHSSGGRASFWIRRAGVPAACPPWDPVGHVVGRIGENHVGRLAIQALGDEGLVGGVAPVEPVGAQLEASARGDPAGLPVVGSEGIVEVELFRAVPFLALGEAGQQGLEIVVGEAAQAEVPFRRGLQVDQEASQQVLIPVAADLVQGDVEQAGVLLGEVEQDHRHRRQPAAPRGDQALMAGDHAVVTAPG